MREYGFSLTRIVPYSRIFYVWRKNQWILSSQISLLFQKLSESMYWMNFHENEISLKRNYEVLRQQVYQSEKSIGTHLLSKTWKSSIPILGAVFNNKDSRSTWASKMTVQMSDSIMIFYGNSSTVSFCWREWIARFSVVVCHN